MKNNKVHNLILVIVLILLVVPVSFLLSKNYKEKTTIENKENEKLTENKIDETEAKKEVTKLEQSISINMNKNKTYKLILKKDGTTYLINNKNLKVDEKNKLGNYEFEDFNSKMICESGKCPQEAYKLDIENVTGLYLTYFGNGTSNQSIILLTNDGKVNELLFKDIEDSVEVELHKNVFNDIFIVNVLVNNSQNGNSAILVDNNGNQYGYYGIETMEQ